MDLKKAEAIIEGILFAAGDSVEIEKLSDILELEKETVRTIIQKMISDYNSLGRGITIIKLENSYQMSTTPEYFEYISQLAEPKRSQSLSNAAMEVLSIVAYKQPVTRLTIEGIRGVSCDSIVNRLVEKNLISEIGRLDAPGKPMIFGTTEEFLRCFGISEISELPDFERIRNSDADLSQQLTTEDISKDADNEVIL